MHSRTRRYTTRPGLFLIPTLALMLLNAACCEWDPFGDDSDPLDQALSQQSNCHGHDGHNTNTPPPNPNAPARFP